MLYTLPERVPEIHPRSYIAPSADIIGQVALGAHASVWFNAVLRGDNDWIRIGARSNVQDGSVLHADPGAPLIIGDEVTIGHSVALHGCRIGDGSLVGIGSRVLNHAIIGAGCIIGANSLITERKTFPEHSLIIGSPGRVARRLSDQEVDSLRGYADRYVEKITRYRALKAL